MTAHSPILRPYPDDTAPLGSALNPASLDDDMGFEDDLVPLDHPVMKEAMAKWNAARDEELLKLSKGHRKFNRDFARQRDDRHG